MSLPEQITDFAYLRSQIIGADTAIKGPFGPKPLVYADYTASGRCLEFVEDALRAHMSLYANTHTEDDETGRSMSALLEEAEHAIKSSVNAGQNGCIVACGDGATAGIYRLQQILGIAMPAVTRQYIDGQLQKSLGVDDYDRVQAELDDARPVVFVGPYEHHSNEISWRTGFAEVVEVDMAADGGLDIGHLEILLQDPRYLGRTRIGSFSAASNVSGMRTPVHEVAKLLHTHGALACFDFAACAPYVEIDMNPANVDTNGDGPGDASLDAIFISPHKFLGGPGSSGILIFNERLYCQSVCPSIAGGGTVSYVNRKDQDFYDDVEEREKAGTPGILQTLKAAMAFQVKDEIGAERLEKRDAELLHRAFGRWHANDQIEILGNPDAERRISIVSFNVKAAKDGNDELYLHPKFVTALLNDLFGIQSRAGCACAGPYGHRLLNIDMEMSERFRGAIAGGISGVKPGWCRIGFHYTMSDVEADYIIEAVEFVAAHGRHFLALYEFDLITGLWAHQDRQDEKAELFPRQSGPGEAAPDYDACLAEARGLAAELSQQPQPQENPLQGPLEELRFFTLPASVRLHKSDGAGPGLWSKIRNIALGA